MNTDQDQLIQRKIIFHFFQTLKDQFPDAQTPDELSDYVCHAHSAIAALVATWISNSLNPDQFHDALVDIMTQAQDALRTTQKVTLQ